MTSAFDPRAALSVVGLLLGGLGIGGAVAVVTAPLTPHLAVAKTMPVARTLPVMRGPGAAVHPATFVGE